jgi:hypothetical protein
LILGLSASAGGSVDDFKQWKGFRFHDGFKRILGLMGDRVRGYCESAYQSIDKRHPKWTMRLPQKAFRNKPFSQSQKTTNRIRSKVGITTHHAPHQDLPILLRQTAEDHPRTASTKMDYCCGYSKSSHNSHSYRARVQDALGVSLM